MGDLPHKVPNDPRFFTADVHVTPDGKARIGGHDYTPAEYADMLKRSGYDGSKPVRLIGCDAGSNDFAQQLSKHLDAPVVAPTKPAWTDSHGRVFTSDAELRPDGTRQPKIPPNGEWETHHPDGSRSKASDDGFAPGTHDKDKDLDPTDAKDRGDSDGADGDADTPEKRRDALIDRANDKNDKFFEDNYKENGHRREAERMIGDDPLPKLKWNENSGKWEAADAGPPPLPHKYKDAPDSAPDRPGPVPDANKDKIDAAVADRETKLATDKAAEEKLAAAKKDVETAQERVKDADEKLKNEDTPANRKEADDAKAAHDDAKQKYADEKADHAKPHEDMTKAGEQLGEDTAEYHAVQEHFPGATKVELPDLGYGQRQFDQVYELPDGRMVVVEAKGPSADLGSSKIEGPGGDKISVGQGRRDYYEHITEAMRTRGETFGNGEDVIAEKLNKALQDGKVEYVVVKPVVKDGGYDGYSLKYFNLDKEAQPGGYQGRN